MARYSVLPLQPGIFLEYHLKGLKLHRWGIFVLHLDSVNQDPRKIKSGKSHILHPTSDITYEFVS